MMLAAYIIGGLAIAAGLILVLAIVLVRRMPEHPHCPALMNLLCRIAFASGHRVDWAFNQKLYKDLIRYAVNVPQAEEWALGLSDEDIRALIYRQPTLLALGIFDKAPRSIQPIIANLWVSV